MFIILLLIYYSLDYNADSFPSRQQNNSNISDEKVRLVRNV